MKTISVTEARNNLAEILNQVAYKTQKFLIKRRGKPVAVLVSPEQAIKVLDQQGINPSNTAGELDFEDVDMEQVFKQIKEPYDKESLLGC